MKEFEATYRRHFEAVFRYALRCTGRRDLAEDVTSEAFLALYRHWNDIDANQLPAWLFTVARNQAIDYWRRSARMVPYEQSVEPAVAPNQNLPSLILNTQALKPIHRVCVTLRYIHGMSRTEIARHTGLTENQVKSSLQYALHLLRKAFASGSRVGDHAREAV